MDGSIMIAEKSLLVASPVVRRPCPVSSRSGPGLGRERDQASSNRDHEAGPCLFPAPEL